MAAKWTKEQQKVIDLRDRNILVSAAAGSGKTAVLVERILKRITEGEQPLDVDELLVVTFTRAAAAQMKERLMAALERKLEEEPDNAHLQRQTTLIHHAQITTIDGFCSYVVRNYFHQIDLDPGFRVADEGEQKLMQQDILQEVLEEAHASEDEDFRYYADCFDDGRSDHRLEEITQRLYAIAQSQPWPEEWLQNLTAPYEIAAKEELLAAPWMKKICALASAFTDEAVQLNALAIQIAEEPDGPGQYLDALYADRDFLGAFKRAEDYEAMGELLTGFKYPALSRKKNPDMDEQKKVRVQQLRDQMKKLLREKVQEVFFTGKAGDIVNDMQKSRRLVEAIVKLTLKFSARFKEARKEKNILDFSDMEHFALKILVARQADGTQMRTAAAKELAGRFAEIMIDEYQDSNLVQEKILTAVSREADGTANIFMVGDVKQSIYKFRLARPELFMEKYDSYEKEDSKKQRIDLHKNFRSRKEVLETSNFLFRQIMTKPLGGIAYDEAAALYAGAGFLPLPEGEGAAELLLLDRDGELPKEAGTAQELEAHMIADRINRMVGRESIVDKRTGEMRKIRYGDIAILLRTMRGWSEAFVSVLKGKGIPVYAASRTGYFSAPEVVVVLNYLRLLDNPRQELPLAGVLQSPIGGLCAQELAEVKAAGGKVPLYECLKRYLEMGKKGALYNKVLTFSENYHAIRRTISYTPVHEVLMLLYEKTGYLRYASAMPAGAQREANLLMLVEKALEYEKSSYSGLFHFVRYIDSLQKYEVDFGEVTLAGEQADLVQIMSIHGSKGLEFPVVFAAGMGKNFNVMDTRDMAVLHADYGIGVPLIDPALRTKRELLYKNMMQAVMREEILGEELRLLYVALTRAEQRLIITASAGGLEKRLPAAVSAARREKEAFSYARLFMAQSCLDWLLPAFAAHPAFEELQKSWAKRQSPEEKEVLSDIACRIPSLSEMGRELPLRLVYVTVEDLLLQEIRGQVQKRKAGEELLSMDKDAVYDDAYRKLLAAHLGFIYPFIIEQTLPAKMSVSDVKLRHYEEEQGHALYKEPEIIPYIPAFMQGSRQTESGGALRGTAYHRMMECLDYKAAVEGISCGEQIKLLMARGMLSREDADMLRSSDFDAFLQSDIGKRMSQAALCGKLHRERQFFLSVSAGEIDEKAADSQERVLIQGIIDAYFEIPEGLVLVDYKTDRVESSDGSDLVEKYRVQLEYYARALERLTRQKVCEKVIYSFALHRELKL